MLHIYVNCITVLSRQAVLTKYSTAQNERALLGYWVDWVESNEGDAEVSFFGAIYRPNINVLHSRLLVDRWVGERVYRSVNLERI